MAETGHFASLWQKLAQRLGLQVEFLPGDWRHGASPQAIEERLAEDRPHAIKAVCVVHNETSTGVTSRVSDVRAAIDRARHPALYMVDTISSLASIDYRHDEWKVDVTVAGSQKGLMLPPGTVVQRDQREGARLQPGPRSCRARIGIGARCSPSIRRGSSRTRRDQPFVRSRRGARDAVRRGSRQCVRAPRPPRRSDAPRGQCLGARDPVRRARAVQLDIDRRPDARGHDADAFRKIVLDRFDMSLGQGLGKLTGKVFRIGHLGYFNELMLAGTLSGVEMGLALAGVPYRKGGIAAALDYLAETAGHRGSGLHLQETAAKPTMAAQ
jgi:alanine-glyoxylate transaminase/serine-glyoxylate transaminase/serine-pyruvate transaminase